MLNKKIKDNWELKYKDCSIWGYFRSEVNRAKITYFLPKIKVGISDLTGMIKFLSIPFRSLDTKIICIPDRDDLIDKVTNEFSEQKILIFIRRESKYGNAFFIESIRKIFHLISNLFYKKDIKLLLSKLSKIDANLGQKKTTLTLKCFFGDYIFNKLISKIIGKREVYYTNCIIPRVERHMGLMNSYEIQHGVIYRGHLDYTDIPQDMIKNGFLAWDMRWRKILIEECNFFTNINVFKKQSSLLPNSTIKYDTLVYTTVCDLFSEKIIEYNKSEKIYIKKHPRDYFDYSLKDCNLVIVNDFVNPKEFRFVVCHDTTLISTLLLNKIYFYYMKTDKENDENIINNLDVKYSAVLGKNYTIVSSISKVGKNGK